MVDWNRFSVPDSGLNPPQPQGHFVHSPRPVQSPRQDAPPSSALESLVQGIGGMSFPAHGVSSGNDNAGLGFGQLGVGAQGDNSAQDLAVNLPSSETLLSVMNNNLDTFSEADKLHWTQDVIRLLDRQLKVATARTSSSGGTTSSHSPNLSHLYPLLTAAIPILLSCTTSSNTHLIPPAQYLKAHLLATGIIPAELDLGMHKDPRQAFKDFEAAARGGEYRAWFRLGRDYETCGEEARARGCFEKGVQKGDGECMYRMGMAHLMGQLGLPSQPHVALPLLRRAADLSTIDSPQSAYLFGMLLAGEYENIPLPTDLILPSNSPPSPSLEAQHREARSYLLKAAYLCFPPAQYKAGWMYEHASLTCGYDPLLSVRWYALASQEGEVEADMALSKWFLVGAEGSFEKNEGLARVFAEKAAKARLASGCFALGYYNELGIGGAKNLEEAKRWYARAAKRGNNDADSRLRALNQAQPSALSGDDHRAAVNSTLIRKHTTAQQRSNQGRYGERRQTQAEDALRRRAQDEANRASGILGGGDGYGAFPRPASAARSTHSGTSTPPSFPDPRAHAMPPIPPTPADRPTSYYPPQGGHIPQISVPANSVPGLFTSSVSFPSAAGPSYPIPSSPSASPRPRPASMMPESGNALRPPQGNGGGRYSPSLSPRPEHTTSQGAPSHTGGYPTNHIRRQSYSLKDGGPILSPDIGQLNTPRPHSQPAMRKDDFLPPGKRPGAENRPGEPYKGAQTFEAMGFSSKPVKDDNDCTIM